MYQFYPQLVLRTPAYPMGTYREGDLQQFLSHAYFRAAIYLASAALYQELEKKAFAVEALSPEVVFTLRKYLNRMCFRPTPFGLFSGVATVDWAKEKNNQLILQSDGVRVKAALGFRETLKLAQELLDRELAPHHTYRSNPARYRVQDELRYLRYESGSDTKHYFVDTVGYQRFLQALLRFCQSEKRKEEVMQFISKAVPATQEECSAFVDQLVQQQLLLSTLEANITGEDYLQRLLDVCQSQQRDTPRVKHARSLLDTLDTVSGAAGKESIGSAILETGQVFRHFRKTKSPLYVNLDLGKAAGGLNQRYQACILEGLECLHRILPMQQPPGLQRFAEAYKKKFEGRAMPLLVALDPEVGVGYEDLAASFSSPKLLEGMELTKARADSPALEWTAVHALLLQKWHGRPGPAATIQFGEQELEGLPPDNSPSALPPTTSVLFRVKRDKVFIEQAGGACAAALLGRFTPMHEALYELAQATARQEQQANPNVVFAEIAQASDAHTANIDRRRVIRDYEIPVLVQSTLPLDRQIPLSDLWVRVEGDQVVLFSQKLQKVIVPRLSSAFNYVREDLAVFRFLCDLQYQGLKATFTLDLGRFFPGLPFYPRVEFKSTVLHLATWHLKKEQFTFVLEAKGEQSLHRLRNLAAEQGWPRYIALTEQDHQLVMDLQQEEDLALLIQALRKKEQVIIKEFPFIEEAAPAVADQAGKPYVHQFLAALYQEQEVYPASKLDLKERAGAKEKKRKQLPGQEWLYFKIYCHPSRANHILTDRVLPVVNRLQKQGAVRQWFFVRYRDPEYHLRVRLSVSPEQAGSVMHMFQQKLARLVEKGVVSTLQLAVYERELERYGPALMEAAEACFCASSALVAGSIKQLACDETDLAYYQAGFWGLEAIAQAFTTDVAEKATLFYGLYERFYQEFGGDRALREQLSARYRAVCRESAWLGDRPEAQQERRPIRKLRQGMQATLREIGQKATGLPPERKTQLAADLMHMHLNRLFVDDPRKQELVTYYCLWRHYKSLLARSRA